MSEQQTAHCPFLNRTDPRCADHFKLDHLQHAFKYCFASYMTCPVYAQRLFERRVRQLTASQGHPHADANPLHQINVRSRPTPAA